MPLLLSLITLIFSVLPFTLGPSSPFFTIDQEVVYVTNALSYVVRKQIPFYDHPGTPGILLLSASFTPLRLWAKYFIHTPFIDWSIKNFTFLMYYSRFFVLIVYCAGLAILLRAVHNFTASRLAVILTWLSLFSYSEFLRIGVRPTPENFLLFSTAVWLWLFLPLVNHPTLVRLVFLNLAAGFSLATKLNSLTLLLITWLVTGVVLVRRNLRFFRLVRLWLFLCGLSLIGFFVSTWTIRGHYRGLFNWSYGLASHLEAGGSGRVGWFDWGLIRASLTTIVRQEPYLVLFFILAPLAYIASFRRLSRFSRLVFGPAILILLTFFFVYAKFPRPHYQWLHLIVLSVFTAVFLNRSVSVSLARVRFKLLPLFFILLLTPLMINRVNTYAKWSVNLAAAAAFEDFISAHPPRYRTLWYIGNTRDFSLLWGRSWSGEFYGPQLDRYYPHLGEIVDFNTYRDNSARTYPIFSVCWDQLYLRRSELDGFLAAHPDKKLTVSAVTNTKYYLITSDHCQKL